MATAAKHARTTRQRDRAVADGAPGESLVFQSNDGKFHWVIVSERGATLARSGAFAPFAAAEAAAGRVRTGAAGARFELRSAAER